MQIKVMPDYGYAPLWWDKGDASVGNIRPEELGLSKALSTDLWAWAAAFDATLVPDDPASSGFKSDIDEQAFENRGRCLTEQLAAQLGATAKVRFWHD